MPLASQGGNWPARMFTWIDGIKSAGAASRAVRCYERLLLDPVAHMRVSALFSVHCSR